MNKNEIFILCLGIGILIIFVSILTFAKGDSVFFLSVFAVAIALILIGICLYLMNNMLNRLDDNSKITGTDLGLLKTAITYIAEDNNNASEYIAQFLEAYVSPHKEIPSENLKVYVPDEMNKSDDNDKVTNESSKKEDNNEITEVKDTNIEVNVQHLDMKPKPVLNLNSVTVSNQVLTDALSRLVANMNAQSVNLTQTVQQVQQVQQTTVQTVVAAIQSDPVVQQAIAETQPLIEAITQSQPIQNIIVNGGNIDLTDIRNSIDNLNTAQLVQGADIIEMDKFLRFVDQTSHYVDEEGVHTTIYNGVDISKLQAILSAGSTINLQTMQASINNLNNIVTTQGTDLTTIDNYLKFVDQTLMYVDEQGNPAVMYPGIK